MSNFAKKKAKVLINKQNKNQNIQELSKQKT